MIGGNYHRRQVPNLMMMGLRPVARPPRNDSNRPFLPFAIIICLFLLLAPFAAASPIPYFPINSQLPPVARVSEPFSFIFSPLTFSSDLEMRYSLAEGSPSWLSIDSASRTLSGTPDDAAVPPNERLVGIPITLVAVDDAGSSSDNVTLVVSRSPAPLVRVPLEDQIDKFGPYSAPGSILRHPSVNFSFNFNAGTFGSHAGYQLLNYYAVSGDNAPLPSWIVFDAQKLAFSGTTPSFESLVQPPQTFDFKLVASDVAGFSSASIDFSIVVGTHELTADKSIVELNATVGTVFEYTGLPELLRLDKRPLGLNKEVLSSIRTDSLPVWLSFDDKTWKLSGTPDAEATPANVTIAVTDDFFDTLNVTLAIKFEAELFVSDQLPDLNVTAGSYFSLDLKRLLFAPEDTQITIQTGPEASWIRLDTNSKVLSGTAPADGLSNEVHISLVASRKRTEAQQTRALNIHLAAPTNTSQPSPSETSKPRTDDNNSRRDLYWLLVIPILIVAIAIILAIFTVRRRRQRTTKLDFSEISAPIPGHFTIKSSVRVSSHDMKKILDAVPPAASLSAQTPAAFSNRVTQATLNQAGLGDDAPHALTLHSGAVKAAGPGSSTLAETGASLSSGHKSRSSPAGTDELSLLSDTSLGEEPHMVEDVFMLLPNTRATRATRHTRPNTYGQKVGLNVATVAGPSSLQPTPDMVYGLARKYDQISDDEMPPAVGYAARRRSGQRYSNGMGFRGIQHRISKAWKRASASQFSGDTRRNSYVSATTDVTTRTSILTSGVTGEATTASTNLVARPTVIHIPGRLSEIRQLSRRTGDSATFFGATQSGRNSGIINDALARAAHPPSENPRGNPSLENINETQANDPWTRNTRNSLGIAYKDLVPADGKDIPYPAGNSP
ncbi:hypothetical protein GGS20DRAFT_522645 [Poronia punctata]|nr:hypothetical protein GGS20DRAFT_522645 [Poronia punctata]